MALSDINFQKQKGGLKANLPNRDHVSGMLFYHNSLPSGFSSTDRIKQIVDITAAEQLGIVADKSDETKATGGNVVITAVGTDGETISIKVDGTVIGSYVKVTGDSIASIAVGLRAAINTLTATTGYSAAGTGANVLLTAPAGLGASINGGTHLVFDTTGTATATVTQFSGGVDAFFDVIHYQIDEFFRLNKNAELHVMIAAEPTTWNFAEVRTLQVTKLGDLRQIMVFQKQHAFTTNDILALQPVQDVLESEHKPFSIVLAANIKAVTDLTTLATVRVDARKVSVVIGQDGDNTGAALARLRPYSITCAGAVLGAISLAKVSEDIAWVGKFKMSAVELDVAAFANGQKVIDLTVTSNNILVSLDTKGYMFLRKHDGAVGSYINFAHACIAENDDYATIERNRTIDKAVRNIRTMLLPYLNGPVDVDATSGKLDFGYIEFLKGEGDKALSDMTTDGELSGGQVLIDAEQNVLSTNNVDVIAELVPKGVAKTMTVKIGFKMKLT